MQNNPLAFWNFSCEKTALEAAELAKEFLEYDSHDTDPFLQSLFELHALPGPPVPPKSTRSATVAPQAPSSTVQQAEEAGVVEMRDEGERQDEGSPEVTEQMEQDIANLRLGQPPESDSEEEESCDETSEKSFLEIQSELASADGVDLSSELRERLINFSKTQIKALLSLLGSLENEEGFVNLCTFVSETSGDVVERRGFAKIICSELFLPKMKDEDISAPLFMCACRIARAMPTVIVPELLIPLSRSEGQEKQAMVIRIITTSDSQDLRLAMLRALLELRLTNVSAGELDLLRLLLSSPSRESDICFRLCDFFVAVGPALSSNLDFSKLLHSTMKSWFLKGMLTEESKKRLAHVISLNKTPLRKIIEKTISGL